MTELLDVADAVVDELNGGSWSQSFTAVRLMLPAFELKDMGTLHVTVVPKTVEREQITRGSQRKKITVDIGVQIKPAAITNDAIDPYVELVEEIADRFDGLHLASLNAQCEVAKSEPVYSIEQLEQTRQFLGVLTLEWGFWP